MTGYQGQNGGVQGMDTEAAREVSRRMGQQAGQIAGMLGTVTPAVEGLTMDGPDADLIKRDWASFASGALTAAQSLDEQAQALDRHADRQDQTSS